MRESFRLLLRCASCALVTAALAACDKSDKPKPAGPVLSEYKPGDPISNPLATARNPSAATQVATGIQTKGQYEPANSGPPVVAADYPWQVGIFVNADNQGNGWRCGGILISPDYVLTAAHCADAADTDDYTKIERFEAAQFEIFHGDITP